MPDTQDKTAEKRRAEVLRAIKFTFFSISAGLVQTLSFTLFNEVFALPYKLAYLFALILSVLWNFTFNRALTFRSANNIPRAMLLVALYYLVFTPLSMYGGDALEQSGWNEYWVLALTMLINFVTEFLYQRFVVFRDSLDTNRLAKKAKEDKQGTA